MDKSDDIDNMFYIGDKESPKAKEFLYPILLIKSPFVKYEIII